MAKESSACSRSVACKTAVNEPQQVEEFQLSEDTLVRSPGTLSPPKTCMAMQNDVRGL